MRTGKRTWAVICAALAAGEILALRAPECGSFWPFAAVLSVLSFSLLPFRAGAFRTAAAVFFAGVALAWRWKASESAVLDALCELGASRPAVLDLKVEGDCSTEETADGGRKACFKASVRGVEVSAVIRLAPGARPPADGETWRCAGWVRRPSRPGLRERFWQARGEEAVCVSGANVWHRAVAAARRSLSRRLSAGLDNLPRARSLYRAMLLGERRLVPRECAAVFADAGTMHVFAISGLHVLLAAKIATIAMSVLLRIPARGAAAAAIPLVWAYAAVAGMGPSVARAAAMATVWFSAPLLWRKSDVFVSWAATFVAFHVVSPGMAANAASLLSFTVMLSLAMFAPAAEAVRRRCAGGARAAAAEFAGKLGMGAAAWCAAAPIVARFFGRLAPAGILANLAMVPAAAFAVAAGSCAVALGFVSERLAAAANVAGAYAVEAMLAFSRLVASIPGCSRPVEPWSDAICAVWYAALAAICAASRRFASRPLRPL